MKKSAIFSVLLIIIIVSAGTYAYFYFYNQPKKSDGNGDDDDDGQLLTKSLVLVYVESNIYKNISNEISQYKQDIINQGYEVKVINWTIPAMILNSEQMLKQNITAYQNQGLVGAVLVGDLPAAYFDLFGSPFLCDLYFMDLDGKWSDLNPSPPPPPNVYDGHGDTSPGSMYPDIWVSRINPTPLNNLNHTKALKNYFVRNHEYRIGKLYRPHKALLYIDDDYSRWHDEWSSNLTSYSDKITYWDNSTTTPAYYKGNLSLNYEFIQAFMHSDPQKHHFGLPNPLEGYVDYNDILATNTTAFFYNFYCCSICDFSSTNNLGTQYLFSNYTLALVGSTKPGAMNMYQSFYDNLSVGKIFGEAFRKWWWDPIYGPYGSSYSTSMGLTIFGDPLLTIFM
jgi:hypothetical protein